MPRLIDDKCKLLIITQMLVLYKLHIIEGTPYLSIDMLLNFLDVKQGSFDRMSGLDSSFRLIACEQQIDQNKDVRNQEAITDKYNVLSDKIGLDRMAELKDRIRYCGNAKAYSTNYYRYFPGEAKSDTCSPYQR